MTLRPLSVDPNGVINTGAAYANAGQILGEYVRQLDRLRGTYYNSWGDDDLGKQFSRKFLEGLDTLSQVVTGVGKSLDFAQVGLMSGGKAYQEAEDDATDGALALQKGIQTLPPYPQGRTDDGQGQGRTDYSEPAPDAPQKRRMLPRDANGPVGSESAPPPDARLKGRVPADTNGSVGSESAPPPDARLKGRVPADTNGSVGSQSAPPPDAPQKRRMLPRDANGPVGSQSAPPPDAPQKRRMLPRDANGPVGSQSAPPPDARLKGRVPADTNGSVGSQSAPPPDAPLKGRVPADANGSVGSQSAPPPDAPLKERVPQAGEQGFCNPSSDVQPAERKATGPLPANAPTSVALSPLMAKAGWADATVDGFPLAEGFVLVEAQALPGGQVRLDTAPYESIIPLAGDHTVLTGNGERILPDEGSQLFLVKHDPDYADISARQEPSYAEFLPDGTAYPYIAQLEPLEPGTNEVEPAPSDDTQAPYPQLASAQPAMPLPTPTLDPISYTLPSYECALINGDPVPTDQHIVTLFEATDGTVRLDANWYNSITPLAQAELTTPDGGVIAHEPGIQHFLVQEKPNPPGPSADGYRPDFIEFSPDGRASPVRWAPPHP